MAGILDNKKRVMDVIITSEGRRQMHNGNLIMKYASFTDTHTFYQADAVSGSADASKRIFLEAASLPIDQITFETDDTGQLIEYEGNGDINMDETGRIYSGSTAVYNTGSYSSAFASMADTLLSGSAENFRNLNMIGTRDPFNPDFFDISVFGGNDQITFEIIGETEDSDGILTSIASPIPDGQSQVGWVNTVEPLWLDWRLSWNSTFKYKIPLVGDSPTFTVEYLNQEDFIAALYDLGMFGLYDGETLVLPEYDDSLLETLCYLGGWKLYNDTIYQDTVLYIPYIADPLTGKPGTEDSNGVEFEYIFSHDTSSAVTGLGYARVDEAFSSGGPAACIIMGIVYGPGKFVDPNDVGEEMAYTGGQSGGVWLPDGYVALGAYMPLSSELALGTDITTDHVPQTEKFGSSTNVVGDAWEFIEHRLSGSWDWSVYDSKSYSGASSTTSGHTNQGIGDASAISTKDSGTNSRAIYDSLPMNEVDFVKRSRYNNMFFTGI